MTQSSKIEVAAKKGDVDAQYQLAAMMATGDGRPKDVAGAARWYKRAANQGHPEAAYNLGFMYLLGEGVKEDANVGLRFLKKAASGASWDALYLLGDLYLHGQFGMARDAKLGVFYHLWSLKNGNARSALALATSLRKQQINSEDLAKSLVQVAKKAGINGQVP
jgi:TPR repeat protein